MGIRESLLNTITSVGSSDFVRIVTSAGASSKATVQNLFKSFETGLGAKSSLTTSDYIRVVGSDNVLYKQSIESISETIDSYNNAAILLTDCNDATDPSKLYYANGSTANRPDNSAWWFIKCEARSGNMLFQTAYWMNSTTVSAYERSRDTNGTWGSWTKMPTRAEVDALNSKTSSIERVGILDVFDVVDANVATIVSNNVGDSQIMKMGRLVFGQVRITVSTATNASTSILSAKNATLKSKWFPVTGITNYCVFPLFKTWDASKQALAFINDDYGLGIGATQPGNYVGTFCYIART